MPPRRNWRKELLDKSIADVVTGLKINGVDFENLEKIVRTDRCQYKCVGCGEDGERDVRSVLTDLYGFSCKSCIRVLTSAKNLEKYGCKHPMQNETVQEKYKATNIRRLGCAYPAQSEAVQEKMMVTNLERYGCENTMQNEAVQEKTRATNLERYGGHPLKNKEVQGKARATNLERYGGHPMQTEEVQEKMRATNLERYGYENSLQNDTVKSKTKATNLLRYGCENPMQNEEVQKRSVTNSYRTKTYRFRTGEEVLVQGYEGVAPYSIRRTFWDTHTKTTNGVTKTIFVTH